jgi:hypothetical protein
MCPIAHADGHDAPRLLDQFVPCVTAMIEDVVIGGKHPVREPVVPHELPDILDRVQLWAFGRQRDDRDIGWHDELMGQVPSEVAPEIRTGC